MSNIYLEITTFPWKEIHKLLTCDMIKRNESDVEDIVFEIGKNSVQIPLFYIVFLALTNSS